MPEQDDDLYMGYSDPNSGGQFTLLPAGQHPVKIARIQKVESKFPNQKTGQYEEQF